MVSTEQKTEPKQDKLNKVYYKIRASRSSNLSSPSIYQSTLERRNKIHDDCEKIKKLWSLIIERLRVYDIIICEGRIYCLFACLKYELFVLKFLEERF